jgi:hypothetical protein
MPEFGAGCQYLVRVILATYEAGIRRIAISGQPGQRLQDGVLQDVINK